MRLGIAGAGTFGQMLAHMLLSLGFASEVVFLDDEPELHGTVVRGLPVVGATRDAGIWRSERLDGVMAAIGDCLVRSRILGFAQTQGFPTPTFVHPRAHVPQGVAVASGVIVLNGTNFMPLSSVSDNVIVSMGVNVAHHSEIGPASFISTGVNIGAGVDIGRQVFIGIGATVMTGVRRIGDGSVIGAGAVVIRDVEPNTVVAGVPARVIKRRPNGWQNE